MQPTRRAAPAATLLLRVLFALLAMAQARAACPEAPALSADWPSQPHAGQVRVAGGRFAMGSQAGYEDEVVRTVEVASFWIDRTEVTNAQFARFVQATGHVTEAERQGGAAVFAIPDAEALRRRPLAWWRFVAGADWRHPEGPHSGIEGRGREPVRQVTQADALAYARWLGRDLPTEAEWEYAAKGGRQQVLGTRLDGQPRDAAGRPSANYWQGSFPLMNTHEDGFAGIAPVACFAPNALGLHDMVGNAWEWTRDPHQGPSQSHANGDPAALRQRAVQLALHSAVAGGARRMVIKGGSFLCAPDHCVRYRASARESQEADLPTAHVGFRTVSRR
ncbi:MAG: formylglycine-generating enzyme family protein [Proteobacteria bacterium]|uniref:formylglycine-generating enzyme family protein n=1 Tax=Aquabacterium sp. TaxID=1872578 RepID=UPI0035C6A889|nr:formylglycine-generating enzyme family protein [Pseudomonadota bacterium]